MTRGYKKKTKTELLAAIDACKSISQLFAIVQHEEIRLQMQSFSSASNLPLNPPAPPRPEEIDSPLNRLKSAVKAAVENR